MLILIIGLRLLLLRYVSLWSDDSVERCERARYYVFAVLKKMMFIRLYCYVVVARMATRFVEMTARCY